MYRWSRGSFRIPSYLAAAVGPGTCKCVADVRCETGMPGALHNRIGRHRRADDCKLASSPPKPWPCRPRRDSRAGNLRYDRLADCRSKDHGKVHGITSFHLHGIFHGLFHRGSWLLGRKTMEIPMVFSRTAKSFPWSFPWSVIVMGCGG